MDAGHIYDLRGLVTRGLVQATDDGGQAQTAQVQTHDGVVRDAVEVLQQFGVASRAPGDGALALLLAVGGDPAHMVALPVGCPAVRFGGLAPGETVLYAADGTRVALRAGGVVEIWGGTQVLVNTGTVTITAPQGVTIVGDVHVTGSLVATGDISDQGAAHGSIGTLRGDYNSHTHPDPQGGTTGLPVPLDP